jgi:uncharacterized protein YukE
MKSLIQLAVVLIIGILVYNYFYGDEQEQQQSKAIFNEAKDLGASAWNLLKSEKEKLEQGKYDEALGKIGSLIDSLRDKAASLKDSNLMDQASKLEEQRQALEQQLSGEGVQSYDNTNAKSEQDTQELRKNWETLIRETEALMKKLESGTPKQ